MFSLNVGHSSSDPKVKAKEEANCLCIHWIGSRVQAKISSGRMELPCLPPPTEAHWLLPGDRRPRGMLGGGCSGKRELVEIVNLVWIQAIKSQSLTNRKLPLQKSVGLLVQEIQNCFLIYAVLESR